MRTSKVGLLAALGLVQGCSCDANHHTSGSGGGEVASTTSSGHGGSGAVGGNGGSAGSAGSGAAGGSSAGGGGAAGCQYQPEPRDPNDTSLWSPIAPTPVVHGALPAAVKLADGRALLTGGALSDGQGCNYSIANADLYDPLTDSWSSVADMPASRSGHRAVLLPDGRVIVSGGAIGGSDCPPTVWLYDPAIDVWSEAAPNLAVYGWVAQVLPSGRVFFLGADLCDGQLDNPPQIYDAATDTWSTALSAPASVSDPSTTLLDGRIVVAASAGPNGGYRRAALYSEATDSWAIVPGHRQLPWQNFFVTISDGRVLVPSQITDILDPATELWSVAGSSGPCRNPDSATALLNDSALVVSGFHSGGAAAVFDPTNNAWRSVASIPDGDRWAHAAVRLDNGSVVVLGGESAGGSGSCPNGSIIVPALTNWKWTP